MLGQNLGAWSMQARLLPYLEEGSLYKNIDFSLGYNAQVTPEGKAVKSTKLPGLMCPTEPNDRPKLNATGDIDNWPINYAANVGVWLVWDPATGRGGEGAFYPNSKLKPANITDGLSKTLCLAEVKAFTPGFQNAGQMNPVMPPDPATVCGMGGTFKPEYSHQEWTDGKMKETGFTTVFPPNTQISCTQVGSAYDVDWVNQGESITATAAPTYSIVTSRSFHNGLVNVSLLDGSARSIGDGIDITTWRALSTRAGGETIDDSRW
jgi:hypothetical protein